jgi:glycosidase
MEDWMLSTNIYEVNLRQYSVEGTFVAFEKHLPRLQDMGVKILWMMPITPISLLNRKGSLGSYYACSDYEEVNPEFGTIEDFKHLVRYAHSLGMRVIIDWVANHTGWDHKWTTEHPEWYKRDELTGNFKQASGMEDIIELDFTNERMRKAMITAMRFWIDNCDIDGFRCDLAFWVPVEFWSEAKSALNALKELFWFAEADPLDSPDYMTVFDAAYTWTWMHKTEEYIKHRFSLNELLQVLDKYHLSAGIKTWFTSNHDENTWNGTEYDKYGSAALALAVFSCTWPGIPLLYSGQELPNKKRLAFFEKDVIEWTEPCELHEFYKKLLHLRLCHPALNNGCTVIRIHTSGDEKVICFVRRDKEHEILVAINFSAVPLRIDIYDRRVAGVFENVFDQERTDLKNSRHLPLKAWGWQLLQKINEPSPDVTKSTGANPEHL